MSLILKINEIKEILKCKEVKLDNNIIKIYLQNAKERVLFLLNNLIYNNNLTGYETILDMGSEHDNINEKQGTNPLLWEFGHIIVFFEQHLLKYLEKDFKYLINNHENYDSFITNRKERFKFRDHTKIKIIYYFNYIFNKLEKWLKNNKLDKITTYLFLLSIFHTEMHNESFIFTSKLLGDKNKFNNNFSFSNDLINLKFVFIKSGTFFQGTYEGQNLIAFDNEKPLFKKNVKSFYFSDIPVTNGIYLNFILGGGYDNMCLWCNNGWKWVKNNKIKKPFYWKKIDSKWKIKEFDKYIDIKLNNPMCHINWYEAKAVAKWLGGRLPTESEWEYAATNNGTTKYPWGNYIKSEYINCDYSGGLCDVNNYSLGNTNHGLKQMIGNIWEWCKEPLYPYNGFEIDPVYREFSYPFFGFKKILRGGSWAIPSYMINTKYRNAQMPDMRFQFTGVRIVKDI